MRSAQLGDRSQTDCSVRQRMAQQWLANVHGRRCDCHRRRRRLTTCSQLHECHSSDTKRRAVNTTSRVNIRLNPKKIPSKGFIVLSDSVGHVEFQKKNLHKSDPGKGVNLHIFKMAANETSNVLLTGYG